MEISASKLAGQSLRPEWLFEAVQWVQAWAASPADSCVPPRVEKIFEIFPPESDLEHQLKHDLLARLRAEQGTWSARQADHSVRPSVQVSREVAPESARLNAAVARAQVLFQSEPETHWTVESLARRVGYNRTDLECAFRRHCSYSLHAYLVICRVDAAKELLRATAWRIEEIAKAVGCRSKVSLYDYFWKVLHMTPDNYRQRWTLVATNDQVRRLISRLYSG